jgi:hypothetical protein
LPLESLAETDADLVVDRCQVGSFDANRVAAGRQEAGEEAAVVLGDEPFARRTRSSR